MKKRKKRFPLYLIAVMVLSMISPHELPGMQVHAESNGVTPVTRANTYEKTGFYRENPFGIMGGFHLVGFNSVETKAHTNGNILTNLLKYRSNFGTSNLEEVSYIRNIENPVSGFKSAGHPKTVLVVGDGIQVGTTDNGNAWTLNGAKADSPSKANNPAGLWKDTNVKFIDLDQEKTKSIAINRRLSEYENSNTTGHFEDVNNQYISIVNPDGVNVYRLNPNGNYSAYNVDARGFVKGKNGSLIINVDLKGKTSFTMPGSRIKYTDGSEAPIAEVTKWQDGNVIWNFYDSSTSDGLYKGKINNARAVTGIILAPAATVDLTQNFNGTVIANDIIVSAESHRTDFTGKTLEPEDLSVKVQKKWNGQKLTSVQVVLLANDQEKQTVELNEENHWSYTFRNLPQKDTSGNKIKYRVDEKKTEGYEKKIEEIVPNEFVITNTKVWTEKVSVPVTKTWVGKAADSVKVHLYADGVEKDSVTLNEGNHWQHTFADLDKYKDGTEIQYTVKEDPIANYQSEVSGDMTAGYTIKNTNIEKICIPVTKTWVGKPAASATVKLLADGIVKDTATLTRDGGWKHTFADLPKYDANDGHEIVYTLDEVKVDGYITGMSGSAKDGFTVTNTITGKVSVPVTKTWVGKAGTSAKIRLYADGVEKDSVTLNEGNHWQHTFAGLDKYKDGVEIQYTVKEDPIANYQSEITGDMTAGYTVKNTNTEKVSVPVTKTWVGKPAASATVKLLADGAVKDTATLTRDGGWKHTFADLPKYDANDGHEIVYTLDEVKVDGYVTGISGTAENGFTVTNTITGKVSVPVTKKWIGDAKNSITINLYADGKKVDSQKLSKDNNWQYTFQDLNQYKDGKEITYTVQEEKVPGYVTTITGDSKNGFIITNTEDTPRTPSKPTTRTITPKTGDNSDILLYGGMQIASLGVLLFLINRKRKHA